MFLGELSLDGSLRHTNGVLPLVALAKDEGIPNVIVPEADAKEAALIEGIKIIPVASLAQLVSYLRGETVIPAYQRDGTLTATAPLMNYTDLADIKGQEHVKRALEVAAAGGHNMIMCGPPGSGKTLLARSLPSILPPDDQRRSPGSHQDLQRQRPAARGYAADQAAPLPLPPLHHFQRRAGGRGTLAQAGRNQPEPPRRPLPR